MTSRVRCTCGYRSPWLPGDARRDRSHLARSAKRIHDRLHSADFHLCRVQVARDTAQSRAKADADPYQWLLFCRAWGLIGWHRASVKRRLAAHGEVR